MSAQTVTEIVNALNRALTDYARERERILSDKRLSELGRGEALALARDSAKATAEAYVKRLWGTPDSNGLLQGGAVWAMLEEAQERLQRARDGADPLDPAVVDLATKRLPSILRQCLTVDDLKVWYSQEATSAEKRALQIMAHAVLDKFGDQGIGFVSDLNQDLLEARETEEVQAARQGLEAADRVALRAVGATQRAAALLGDAPRLWGMSPIDVALRGTEREGPGRWRKVPVVEIAFRSKVEEGVARVLDPEQPPPGVETDEEKRARLLGERL